MGPKEGNSVVKHGVLDERLNVHGVKGLKVSDLSVCPDNGMHPSPPSIHLIFVIILTSISWLQHLLHRTPHRREMCRPDRRRPRILRQGLGHEDSELHSPDGGSYRCQGSCEVVDGGRGSRDWMRPIRLN
jgi:hypothetical protein